MLNSDSDHPEEHMGDCSTSAHWGYVLHVVGGLLCGGCVKYFDDEDDDKGLLSS